jgi:hypothetical protein
MRAIKMGASPANLEAGCDTSMNETVWLTSNGCVSVCVCGWQKAPSHCKKRNSEL